MLVACGASAPAEITLDEAADGVSYIDLKTGTGLGWAPTHNPDFVELADDSITSIYKVPVPLEIGAHVTAIAFDLENDDAACDFTVEFVIEGAGHYGAKAVIVVNAGAGRVQAVEEVDVTAIAGARYSAWLESSCTYDGRPAGDPGDHRVNAAPGALQAFRVGFAVE